MKTRITILGSGPGGIEAAITAAKLGADVTVIEEKNVGGTCLNQGCIPTKIYLAGASLLEDVQNANFYGVSIDEARMAQAELLERKNREVKLLRDGIAAQFDELGIKCIKAHAILKDQRTILAQYKSGQVETIPTDKIIIATGSLPLTPDIFLYDGEKVLTSNELLELDNLPESIILIGGNVVACEVAQYLTRFGVKVTLIEALEHIVPFEDEDISRQLARVLKREGVKILTKTRVDHSKLTDDQVVVTAENGRTFKANKVLVCIGRKPNTDNLNLEAVGIQVDQKGFIPVDSHNETNIPGIFAIGDNITSPMLAHVASYEGIVAANNACGILTEANYDAVPRCIYTEPEIASVGITEKEAIQKGIKYKVGKCSFKQIGKAHVVDKTRGFVKVIADESGKLIGASIFGSRASEIISELILAIQLELKAEVLAMMIHPHPTFSEAIMQACRAIN